MRITAKTAERGHGSRWRKARAAYLAEPGNRVCRKCRSTGLLNPGTLRMDVSLELDPRRIGLVVDHVIPHRGDQPSLRQPEGRGAGHDPQDAGQNGNGRRKTCRKTDPK